MISKIIRHLLFSIFLLTLNPAHASMVLPLGLDRLHQDAEKIFLGKCLSNTVQQDPGSGMVVTYTTFEVIETFKGQLGATHTIKQVGGKLPGATIVTRIAGVPEFEIGQRYVLFLPPVSSKGFSTPVGLQQGAFRVHDMPQGRLSVSNGRDIGDLLENMPGNKIPERITTTLQSMPDRTTPAHAKARSSMDLDDFRTLVQGMEP